MDDLTTDAEVDAALAVLNEEGVVLPYDPEAANRALIRRVLQAANAEVWRQWRAR